MLHPDKRHQPHPYAEIFPFPSDEDFAKIKADIAKHGQQQTILLYNDTILDGRVRERACVELGIAPRCAPAAVKTDAEALELVMSLNEHRRHLSIEQRAFAAARYVNVKQGKLQGDRPLTSAERKERYKDKKSGTKAINSKASVPSSNVTVLDAAKRMKVSVAAIARARRVLKHGSKDLEQEVISGKKKLHVADDLNRKPRQSTKQPKKKPTLYEQQAALSQRLGNRRVLTPEQVDPDFKGTPIEFAHKHGHVQVFSAAEKAVQESLARCDLLFSALKDCKAKLPTEAITAGEVEAWLLYYSKKAVERNARRATLRQNLDGLLKAVAWLQPLLAALAKVPKKEDA